MPVTLVAPVESYRIPGQQSSHNRGNGHGSGSEKEMDMIGDQRPGKAGSLGFPHLYIQSIQEVFPILVILEDLPAIDSPENDMVHCSGRVYS